MLTQTLYLLMMFNSSMLILTSQPLPFDLMILTFALLISLSSATMLNSMWFSYILFLIYLGGLLILFIYVTSLAPNEKLNMNYKMITSMIMLMLLASFLLLNKYHPYSPLNPMTIPIAKLYSTSTSLLTLLMVLYLLITLFIVVFLTTLDKGPLRMSN